MEEQAKHISIINDPEIITPEKLKFMAFNGENESVYSISVSYTHLTLPTSDLV